MFTFFPTDKPPTAVELASNLGRAVKKISFQEYHSDIAKSAAVIPLSLPNLSLKYISLGYLSESPLVEDGVKEILKSCSDIHSGEYEGGFKLWESTNDLLLFMEDNPSVLEEGSRVLDLGCGHGLLGLYSLHKKASHVVFQDYNEEVISYLTMPNVLINFGEDLSSRHCSFWSGSWSSFNAASPDSAKFDVILSSETIYAPQYLQDFIRVIQQQLKGGGSLYLAAKTFYFGVGGGTRAFLSALKDHPSLDGRTVKTIREGVQREIIQVTKCSPS